MAVVRVFFIATIQIIGVGGRDTSAEIGGVTMLQGLRKLIDDTATRVIVLVSKAPHEDVAAKV